MNENETELSFLLNLLLNHKLPKVTRDCVAARMIKVESTLNVAPLDTPIYEPCQFSSGTMSKEMRWKDPTPPFVVTSRSNDGTVTTNQAPSTLALMAKHGDIPPVTLPPPPPPPEPVAVIAQTPQTAAAMQSRHQAIAEAMAGKVDKVTGRPKKW